MHLFSFKPKNKFSLENLKYLCNTLSKNRIITPQNKNLIVESLRQLAEVLIWGDQHNACFFDFFLEKNVLSYFLNILDQKCSTEVIIQLLQTLSILVENLKTQNSMYFLLSNNYMNEIIIHKYDFSSEEVLDYYISLLKALSLKVDKTTVNFFFDGTEKDFPLYTEAIKFCGHKESMIRIAVRTLTLNIFKVEHDDMRSFIINSTAVPYFSNLVWFIRKECIQLNDVLEKSSHSGGLYQLNYYVEELTDQFYYLHDIFNLGFESMNIVLAEQFIQYLIFPVLIGSLIDPAKNPDAAKEDRLTPTLALFLLSQVFHIFTYKPLLNTLASAMFTTTLNQSLLFLSTNNVPPPPPLSSIGSQREHYNSFRRISSSPNLADMDKKDSKKTSKKSNDSSITKPKVIPPPTNAPQQQVDPQSNNSMSNEVNIAVLSIHNALTSSTDSALSNHLAATAAAGSVTGAPDQSSPSSSMSSSFNNNNNNNTTTYKFSRIEFKESLLKFIQNDRETFGVICMLYSFLKNTLIERKILEMGGILPYRYAKAKKLLEGLLSPDSKSPSTTSPIKRRVQQSEKSKLSTSVGGTNLFSSADNNSTSSIGDNVSADENNTNDADESMSTSLPIGLGLGASHNRSKSESHAAIFLNNIDIVDQPTSSSLFKSKLTELSASFDNTAQFSGTSPTNSTNSEKLTKSKSSSGNGSAKIGANRKILLKPKQESSLEEEFVPYPESGQNDFTRNLVNKLFYILVNSNQFRLVTLQMTLLLLKELVYTPESTKITEHQYELLEHAYEKVCNNLKERISGNLNEVFLEIFEEEMRSYKQIYFESLIKDVALILPVPETPQSRLSLARRLPSGEAEKTQKAIQQFFVLRELKYTLLRRKDTMLPLKQLPPPNIKVGDSFIIDHESFDLFYYYLITDSSALKWDPTKKKTIQCGLLYQNLLLTIELNSNNSFMTNNTTATFKKQVSSIDLSHQTNSPSSTSTSSLPSTPNKVVVVMDATDPLSSKPSTPRDMVVVNSNNSISTNGNSGIILHIAPLQKLEIEVKDSTTLKVTSHLTTWNIEMGFDEEQQCQKAKQLLESACEEIRSNKMRQIYSLLGEKDPYSDDSIEKLNHLIKQEKEKEEKEEKEENEKLVDSGNEEDINHQNQHQNVNQQQQQQFNYSSDDEEFSKVSTPIDTSNSHPLSFDSDDDENRYHQVYSTNNNINNFNNPSVGIGNGGSNNPSPNVQTPQKKRNSSSSSTTISSSLSNEFVNDQRIDELKSQEKKRNSIERKGDIFSTFFNNQTIKDDINLLDNDNQNQNSDNSNNTSTQGIEDIDNLSLLKTINQDHSVLTKTNPTVL